MKVKTLLLLLAFSLTVLFSNSFASSAIIVSSVDKAYKVEQVEKTVDYLWPCPHEWQIPPRCR